MTTINVNTSSPPRIVELILYDPATAVATGEEIEYFRVNSLINGWYLSAVAAHVSTVSTSGLPTMQVRNVTTTNDMLSTALTIDANEVDSSTAATPAVINASFKTVSTADEIAIDVDTAGTGTMGLNVQLTFTAP